MGGQELVAVKCPEPKARDMSDDVTMDLWSEVLSPRGSEGPHWLN